jgi:type 1 glutamine amidotransferase
MLCILMVTPIAAEKITVLIIDGQNNHQWQIATQVLKAILESSGAFQVQVHTSPPQGEDMSTFRPQFGAFDVVLTNYNGDPWPEETKQAFVEYVRSGGGFIVYHAADNPFPDWPEYNEIIGLGGWGDRDEKAGPYVRWENGKVVRDDSPGRGGSHGRRHEFVIDNRLPEHPIMQDLPARWLHSTDELYDRLRGPAKNLEILATAFSDPDTGGTGKHEPILLTIRYGEGRVFHTVLGDNIRPLFDVGFQVTLLRGTEWAATGSVTLPVPPQELSSSKIVTRDPFSPYLQDAVGWRPLFNGKDLTGWEQVNGSASYEVLRDSGELVGTTAKGSPNSFLSTTDVYADFELRFEVMLDNPELNSGVQVRSDQYAQDQEVEIGGRRIRQRKGRVYGYQVEIEASRDANYPDDNYGDAGFIYDEARRGWLSPETDRNTPSKRAAFHNDQWNQYHIRCVGDHLETWVNGMKIADLRDGLTASGRIMLQVHSIPEDQGPWSVRWRNIYVRVLD